MRTRGARAVGLVVLAAVFVLSGCGGGGAPPGPSPAAAAAPSGPVEYVGPLADVAPAGPA